MKLLHIATKLNLFHPRLFYKWNKTTELKFNSFVIASWNNKIVIYNNGNIGTFARNKIKAISQIIKFAKNNNFDVIHIHHPENLIIAPFIKKTKIVYDVYENFLQNRIYSKAYKNKIVKIPEGLAIRTVEKTLLNNINTIIYAEKSYQNFLNAKKYIIIENKFIHITNQKIKLFPDKINFVYTGTISETWGIFASIEIMKKLHNLIPNISLTIVGYTPRKKTIVKLKNTLKKCSFPTKIIGGNKWISYETVQKYQNGADVGIAIYIPDKSIQNKFPTKFYEWLALKKIFLFSKTNQWIEKLKKYENAIPVNILTPDIYKIAEQILISLNKKYFYNTKFLYWDKRKILKKYINILYTQSN